MRREAKTLAALNTPLGAETPYNPAGPQFLSPGGSWRSPQLELLEVHMHKTLVDVSVWVLFLGGLVGFVMALLKLFV